MVKAALSSNVVQSDPAPSVDIEQSYGRGLGPSYVENILGHTRQFYINQDRRDRELLSSIVKVPSISISWFYIDILFFYTDQS